MKRLLLFLLFGLNQLHAAQPADTLPKDDTALTVNLAEGKNLFSFLRKMGKITHL